MVSLWFLELVVILSEKIRENSLMKLILELFNSSLNAFNVLVERRKLFGAERLEGQGIGLDVHYQLVEIFGVLLCGGDVLLILL